MNKTATTILKLMAGTAVSLAAGAVPLQESHLAQLLNDRTRWIGAPDTLPGMSSRGSLTRAVSGRIAPDGQHIVVLDSEAPFVKVFRRDGVLRSEFIRKGGGPGEMRNPHTVAVNARNQVLVLDAPNRAQLYDLDGNRQLDVTTTDHIMMDAVEGCTGDWLVYGLARGEGANPWLTRMSVEGNALKYEAVYSDAQRPDRLGFGNARGMVRHGNGVVLDHRAGTDRKLIEWRCGQRDARARDLAVLFEEFIPKEQRNGNTRSFQLVEGQEMASGVAAVDSTLLFFDRIITRSGKPPRSHVTVLNGNKPVRYTVEAELRALDSRAGHGVLFTASDPYPHVTVITENDLKSALRLRQP